MKENNEKLGCGIISHFTSRMILISVWGVTCRTNHEHQFVFIYKKGLKQTGKQNKTKTQFKLLLLSSAFTAVMENPAQQLKMLL